MKKTYIIPEMAITIVEVTSNLLTESPNVGINTAGSVDAGSVGVKGNSSTPSYNVWDDDWSNN